MAASRTQPPPAPADAPPPKPRRSFAMPWGLLLALAAYYGLVTGYVWLQYWNSPEYAAALHLRQAGGLLGREDGRTAPKEALLEAYEHLLEAVRLLPDEGWIHKELEKVHWRLDQRGWTLPEDLKHRADAVAIISQRRESARKPILAVGARDRGWDAETILNGPVKTFLWSLVGAFGIVVIWGQLKFSEKRRWAADHEAELRKLEAEVEELGEWRKGLKNEGASTAPPRPKPAVKRAAGAARPKRPPPKA